MKATLSLATLLLLCFLASPVGWGLTTQPDGSQLVSHLFVHNSWSHLAANLLTLLVFGAWFERKQGAAALLALFLGAGVLSGLAEVWADPGYTGAIMGASGGLSAFLGAFARFERWAALVVLPILAYYSWQALVPGGPNADWAHLAGLVIGLVWAAAPGRSSTIEQHSDNRNALPQAI